ncbi:MAG TPA: HAD hydrolase-like protein [Acidimicrobiales bacterium]|nr:HAD hydrolase-like protein [Acidimicrobiales bacterium]
MTRLILWDVDGTLIHSDGIGAQVFDRAFEQVLGLAPTARITDLVRLSGKTDPQIALEYLELMEIADPHDQMPLLLKVLEAELAGAAEQLAAHGGALPGVPAALARLAAVDGMHQTLLTGNLAANAAVKVGAFGLERWLDLDIGAYGSDHADRRQLVPIARERARRLRGLELAAADIWVVGDTERDLGCARAGGAHCLLVATGSTPLDELAALHPDAVLPDLADTVAVVDLLTA